MHYDIFKMLIFLTLIIFGNQSFLQFQALLVWTRSPAQLARWILVAKVYCQSLWDVRVRMFSDIDVIHVDLSPPMLTCLNDIKQTI